MILLEKSKHFHLLEPLKQVTINNFFARAVIENKVAGSIYVDNADAPKTFYVLHPYGMSLLFGKSDNLAFNDEFREYALNKNHVRDRYEWMQAFPGNWTTVLANLFDGRLIKSDENRSNLESGIIELNTRVNFKFNPEKYLKRVPSGPDPGISLVRTDKQIFEAMSGTVVPKYFWDDAEDFVRYGVGYSLSYEGKLAATAYSAFVNENKLELGIETVSDFRGKGFAQLVCSALIDYCLENHYEPVWACKLENIGSYQLAAKLGFEPALMLPYYRLSN